jgi:hypothetical protein
MIKHYRKRNETLKDVNGKQLLSYTHVYTLFGHVFFKVNYQTSPSVRLLAVTFFEFIQLVAMGNAIKGTHLQLYGAIGWLEAAGGISLHSTFWR